MLIRIYVFVMRHSTHCLMCQHATVLAGRHTYAEGGDEVEQAYKALVQHMCVKTPDKAEYRHRLAKVGC